MASRKPPKRLFKNRDVIHSYQHDREAKAGMKQITRDHPDVLQNIEFILVSCAREDPAIDDDIIDRAIQVALGRWDVAGETDPRVMTLCNALEGIRATREDVPETIWRAGLRTVDESVRRHSARKPGEKSYLQFVGPYIK
jgi:hypothetical protein